ncbi:MAG: nucleotidyltransferase domain-containing protein [Candidatus Hydrothermarchaeaceae archaeon]
MEGIVEKCQEVYGRVHAACIYGSQVCGYATKESDVDVLVVLQDYDKGVEYTYVKDSIEIAFLGVSREVFEADAERAEYGGFISDRLINPIQPIINEKYIWDAEVAVKKRIVEWEAAKLVYKQRERSEFLEINLLYFPYKKWKKMSEIYRPYVYSIENVLRSDLRERNLRALLPGYRRALKELGFFKEVYPGWYRMDRRFIRQLLDKPIPARLQRIKMAEREAEELVARYLTHKKAGGSDKELVIKEIISKVGREMRRIRASTKGGLEEPGKFIIGAR